MAQIIHTFPRGIVYMFPSLAMNSTCFGVIDSANEHRGEMDKVRDISKRPNQTSSETV